MKEPIFTDDYVSTTDYYTQKIKWYMYQRDVPEEIIDDLLYWSNVARDTTDINFKYLLADRLLEILMDDRFIIFTCETCGETTVTADLDVEEQLFFTNPNGPDFDDFMASDRQLCPDCEADQELIGD